MKRWLLIFLLSLSIVGNFPFSSSESIVIDDEWAYLEADPHTIGSSGWVEFTLISKRFSGNIDVAWGFNTLEALPKNPQIWKNYTHTLWRWGEDNATDELVLYDIIDYEAIPVEEFLNQTDRIGNEWNTEFYRVNATFHKGEDFEEIDEKYIGLFDKSGNLTKLQISYYYTTTVKEYYQKTFPDWKHWDVDFKVVNYSYSDMDTWYLLRNIPVEINKEYRVRAWIEIPWAGLKEIKGKYCWGIKLSSDSIWDAIEFGRFYFIDPWWHSSWRTVNRLIFNNSASAEDLVNFPVLVNLTSTNFDWTKVQNDGDDIRFLDSDNDTQLCYELEYWNYTGQEAQIWVNVPQIDLGSTTDHIFLYYGNYMASSGENVEGTWNSDYVMVQHLQESSGSIYDSTANSNDGTASPTTFGQDKWISGLRGNALKTHNDAERLISQNSISVGVNQSFSISLWYKNDRLDSEDGQDFIFFHYEASNKQIYYKVYQTATQRSYCVLITQSDGSQIAKTVTIPIGEEHDWHNHIVLYNDTAKTVYLYIDNSLGNTLSAPKGLNSINDTLSLGATHLGASPTNGTIDDVMYFNRVINSTEISYLYNSGNGNDPLNSTGLYVWYKLDESGLTENATDSSGSGNHGTLYGYPPEYTSSGQIDGATDFDGNEDYETVPHSTSLNIGNVGDEYTITFWVKIKETRNYFERVITKEASVYPFTFRFYTDSTTVQLGIYNGSKNPSVNKALVLGDWTFMAGVVKRGDSIALYKNGGTPANVSDSTTGDLRNVANVLIGGKTPDRYSCVDIDECRISNTSRSADWIEAQYLSMTDQFITFGTSKTHTELPGGSSSPRYDWPLIESEVCDKIPTIPQFIYNKYTPRFVISINNDRRSSIYLKANIEITNHDEPVYKTSEDIIIYPQSKDEVTFNLPLYFSRGYIDLNREPLIFKLKFSIMRMNSEPVITDFEIKPPRNYATLRSLMIIGTIIAIIYLIYDFTS